MEGGYSNDPADQGGETYRGISRVYHPSWEGWAYIDISKRSDTPIKDDYMEPFVRLFYRRMYWDVNRLGEMPQDLADELYDTGVNMGIGRAAKYLQIGLNCLNRDEAMFDDLVEDGNIGPKTLGAIEIVCKNPADLVTLLKILNVLQGMHYIEYMRQSPIQEKFARGWFKRVEIGKW